MTESPRPPSEAEHIAALERRIAQLEQQLAQFVQEVPCGVAVYDAVDGGTDFVFRDLSPWSETVESVRREGVIGRRVTEVFPSIREIGLFDVFVSVWQTGEPQTLTNTFYQDDRISGWRKNRVFRQADGTIVAVYEDLSPRMEVEAALRTERDRLKQVFDSTLVALVVTDPTGAVAYASPRASALLCLPRNQILGRTFDHTTLKLSRTDGVEVLPGDHPLALVKRLGKTPADDIYRYEDRTGDRRLLRVAAAPVVNNQGTVSEFVFTLADVTEDYHRRSELERAERNLSHAQRLGAVGSWEVRPNVDGQWWSEEMFRLHGLDARHDDPDVNRLLERVYAPDRESYLQFLHRLRSRPGRYACEYRVHAQLGPPRILRAFGHHESAPGGRPSGHIVGFCQDVTEQRAAEEAQRNARLAAESANRAKSEFLAVMSHELRTPLNAVRGFADLIQSTTAHDRTRAYARYIIQGADNLTAIIQDILDISSIEAGQLHLEDEPFSPWGIVGEVTRTVMPRASESRLALVSDVSIEVPPFVRGDPQRLRQILLNLVGNAIKFTEQGAVTLRVEPGVLKNAPALCWTVEDTGIGIPEEKLPHIFDAFTQVDSSLTRRYEGIGLGLSISKRLAELMGGRIDVESTVGEGSTFRLVLPYEHAPGFEPFAEDSAPRELEHQPTPIDGARPQRTILVVEDDPINVALIVEVLKKLPLEVTLSSNGAAAVEKVQESSYDAVLMDVQLPGMNGLDATRTIRSLQNPDHPPIIIGISAHALEHHRDEALAAGMDLYMPKPILPSVLLRELRTRLGLA